MSSTPSVLRELVAHLTRAQHAVDAGHFEDAERAIAQVLAIDPGNVHATDLQNRILSGRRATARSRRGPSLPSRESAALAPDRAIDGGRSAPSGMPPEAHRTGQVSPAAWSAFEGRVRARRADRAVAVAQTAIARGDRETACAALAELDLVSPADSRRDLITAHLDLLPVEPVRPQWPPLLPPAVSAGPVTPERTAVADLELARPVHPVETGVREHRASPSLRAAERRPRGSRARKVFAAAGVLLGALLLGWSITRTSFAPETSVRAVRDQGRADVAFDPTGASAPPVPDNLQDTFVKATPDPTLLSPDGGPSSSTAAEADPQPSTGGVPAERAGSANSPSAEPQTGIASSGQLTGASPAPAASIGPAPPVDDPSPVPPSGPPLDSPVQAVATPATRRSPAPRLETEDHGVAPVALPETPAPAAAAVSAGAPPAPPVDAAAVAVRGVLEGYANAYSALDAEATQRVWPGVDLRGLRRAFEQLSAQTVRFDRCDVTASGDLAEAVCVGRTTWVPRVGDQSPRSEAHTWQFALGRDGNDWLIERVQVKR